MNQHALLTEDRQTENVSASTVGSSNVGRRRVICMIAYTNYVVDARVKREAETLAAAGFRVICLTTRHHPAEPTFVVNNVEVRELGVPKFRGKSKALYILFYVRFLVAASLACIRLLARKELDAVHVHNMPDFLVFAALIPRLLGKPVILDVHDTVPETFAAKFADDSAMWRVLCLEEKISAAVAHKIICVNGPQRDTIVGRGVSRAKTFISMNVPDPRVFSTSAPRAVAARTDGAFNLVYHGTMVERLGVDLVIQAVARLRDRIPGVRLHLFGGGDDLPKFQELVRTLGIADAVVFNPSGYRVDQLPAMLATMDVCVIGNRRSVATQLMLPVKLMESVALGIPAVVPRLRTIQHYFDDDMVSYYEPEDVESLADRVCRLYSNHNLRRQQAQSAQAFLTQYGWEKQGAELVALYRQLVGRQS
jgi:glycosyltransferase involved in cell wall biosynthesis